MSKTAQTVVKQKRTSPNKKWDKLGVELENFIKSHMSQNGQITVPLKELFKEFAKKHDTTAGSVSFYYYNSGFKNRIFEPNGQSVAEKVIKKDKKEVEKEAKAEEVKRDSEGLNVSKNSNNKDLNVENEVKNLIGYIEEKFKIKVSDKSAEMLQEIVEQAGVIPTLLAINKAAENYDKLDISFILVKEAKSRL